jgi:hypothetical protein
MIDVKQNHDYHKQVDRHGYSEALPCIVCGKAVKNPKHHVRLFYGVTVVTNDEANAIIEREGGGGDLSYYPIGANCLRNHPELKMYVDDAHAREGEQTA